MLRSSLSWPSRGMVIVLALVVVAALLQDRVPLASVLPIAGALVLGALRLRARVPALMNSTRVSAKTGLGLIVLFLLALVPAGHGVAPMALFLVAGWEKFPVGTSLAWLAVGCLGAGVVLRARAAPALSMIGSALALAAWALAEAHADDLLAGVVFSLPFLGCLVLHVIHVWRIRPAALPAGG